MKTRADQMAASLVSVAIATGLGEEDVERLGRLHDLAMAPRLAALDDDHHPAYLHPSRSALVLLRDVGRLDLSVFALAMLHDSADFELRPDVEAARALLPATTADTLETLPCPGDERLVERLVGLESGAALAVLAERLDHLRHLHMREDRSAGWSVTHDEVGRAWLPFSQRVHPRLATRFAHWHRVFGRRIDRGQLPRV